MSDLYSVLKQSILDRRLRSPAARKDVYAQARTAVIRQLWTYDPPLEQDEIDQRIGEFDEAVKRLEQEMVRSFAGVEPPRLPARQARQASPPPPAPVIEGYDEAADYTPAATARQSPSADKSEQRMRLPARRQTSEPASPIDASMMAEIEAALAERSAAIEEALRQQEEGRGHRQPPAAAVEPQYDEVDDRYEELPPEPEPDDDPPRRWTPPARHPFDRDRDQPAADAEYDHYRDDEQDAEEGEHRDDDYDQPRPSRRIPSWRDLAERQRILVLLGLIGALAIVLILLAIILLLPSHQPAGQAASASSAVAPDPQVTAAEPQSISQSFVVFDGKDPTVFQTGPTNPIRFSGSTGDAFARISSSSSDAGVRVLISPSLAGELAGHSIRLTLVARSAHENGAVGLRFAYQSGVALSSWATANLQPAYASLALTWRVPTQRTDPDGDYVLIEPGIPGDGTGADIKSINIDLLDDPASS